MPHLYHYIAITDKVTGNTTYEKHYKGSQRTGDRGEQYWSTYRWQLEGFVDKLRGRTPTHWVTNDSSIDQMKTIDAIYEKASGVHAVSPICSLTSHAFQSGLPLRKPTNNLVQ